MHTITSTGQKFSTRNLLFALFALIIGMMLIVLAWSTSSMAVGNNVTKLLVIIEENKSFQQMKNQMPYAYSQAQKYSYATNYKGVAHPSLPNYIVMASGNKNGVTSNGHSQNKITGPTVFGKAIAAGKTAKVYAETMNGNCGSTENNGGRYAPRHNPWLYFKSERALCKKFDVPFAGNFDRDVANGNLPNVGMVVPNNCNNAHDCSLKTADNWFKSRMQTIYSGPDWKSGKLAVILTADEDDKRSGQKVLTVVMHPSLKNKVITSSLDHYSLSRMYSEVSGTKPISQAASANSMLDAFGLSTPSVPTNPSGGGNNPSGSPAPSNSSITCDDIKTSIIEVDCKDNAIWGILLLIVTIMTAGVGLLAVGGLIYGAILYATAQNNSGQITKAKETIANVILGLVLFAFMWSLLQFLIPGGVFS